MSRERRCCRLSCFLNFGLSTALKKQETANDGQLHSDSTIQSVIMVQHGMAMSEGLTLWTM